MAKKKLLSFPLLPIKELCDFINVHFNIKFVKTDFTNGTKKKWSTLYTDICKLFNVFIEFDDIESFEHIQTVQKRLNYFFNKFCLYTGTPIHIGLRDILQPNKTRSIFFISGLINWYNFVKNSKEKVSSEKQISEVKDILALMTEKKASDKISNSEFDKQLIIEKETLEKLNIIKDQIEEMKKNISSISAENNKLKQIRNTQSTRYNSLCQLHQRRIAEKEKIDTSMDFDPNGEYLESKIKSSLDKTNQMIPKITDLDKFIDQVTKFDYIKVNSYCQQVFKISNEIREDTKEIDDIQKIISDNETIIVNLGKKMTNTHKDLVNLKKTTERQRMMYPLIKKEIEMQYNSEKAMNVKIMEELINTEGTLSVSEENMSSFEIKISKNISMINVLIKKYQDKFYGAIEEINFLCNKNY